MIRLIRILIFSLLLSNIGIAQSGESMNTIVPPSPEASAIAEYAKIPISLNTGLANIDLPLLELKGKDINLPISLRYHSAGNKVSEISSSVGLGFTLNAGGAVTRVVRGKPDDQLNGYLGANRQGLKTNSLTSLIASDNFPRFSSNFWDAQPDVYFFSFLGYSGRFTLDAFGNVIMTPEQDFKIIPAFGPLSTSNYWTIIDTNGNQYKFGVTSNAREESKSFNIKGEDNITPENYISTWFLSSIESNTGDTFSFEYHEGTDLSFETKLDLYGVSSFGNNFGSRNNTVDILDHRTIKKITSRFGRVEISSQADRADVPTASRITDLKLYNHSNNLIKTIKLNHSYFDAAGNCSAPECKRLKLVSVDEDFDYLKSIKKYEFAYNNTKLPGRYSPEIDHWGYYNANGQTNLISRTAPLDIDSHRAPNESAAKADILEKIIYATGGYTKFIYGLNEHRSGGSNIQSGGLRIETKEENDNQGNIIVTNYLYSKENTTISSGTQYDIPIYTKNFLYISSYIDQNGYSRPSYNTGTRTQSSSLNEIFDLNGSPISYGEVVTTFADGTKEIHTYTDLITNGDERVDVDTFSTFSTANSSGTNTDVLDEIDPNNDFYAPPSKRNAYQRGLLLEKIVKDPFGNKTYQLNNIYEEDDTNLKLSTGYIFEQLYRYDEYVPSGNQPPAPQSVLSQVIYKYNVSRYIESNRNYRLTNSVEKTFDGANELSKVIDYTYTLDKPTLLKTQTTILSNGEESKVEYVYPFELTGTVNTVFTQSNQIANYIEKREYINNDQLNFEERLFGYNTSGYINNGGTPLPKNTNFKKGSLATYSNLTVDKYDSYGNILQYHGNDNVPMSIIWGYGNRYPIAKIVNATYDQATDSGFGLNMTTLNSNNPSDASIRAEIAKIRNHSSMSGARVTGYTYTPLIGVTGITDTRGYLTTYEYDDFNRLKFVRDEDGNLITENIYQYVTQNNGDGSSNTQLITRVTYGASSDTYQDFIATVSGGSGNYSYKWYRGIGSSSTNFESNPYGLSNTFRLSVSCSSFQYVKLIVTSGSLTSTRIIRSNNSPCSNGGGGGSQPIE